VYPAFQGTFFRTRSSGAGLPPVCVQPTAARNGKHSTCGVGTSTGMSAYAANGAVTPQLTGLHLRGNDDPEFVKAVMLGTRNSAADVPTALRIIVYQVHDDCSRGEPPAFVLRVPRHCLLHLQLADGDEPLQAIWLRINRRDCTGVRVQNAR
jgi:hypothetical protein